MIQIIKVIKEDLVLKKKIVILKLVSLLKLKKQSNHALLLKNLIVTLMKLTNLLKKI